MGGDSSSRRPEDAGANDHDEKFVKQTRTGRGPPTSTVARLLRPEAQPADSKRAMSPAVLKARRQVSRRFKYLPDTGDRVRADVRG